MSAYDFQFKLIIVGDSDVGKSCLVSQFKDQEFNANNEITVGCDLSIKVIQHKEKVIKLQLWDTAGSEHYRSMGSTYYKGAAVALLVFDQSRIQSFENMQGWLDEVKFHGNSMTDIVLVGNKQDLESEVDQDRIEAFTKQNGCRFMPVSAKTGSNVKEMFDLACELVMKRIDEGKIDFSNEGFGVKLGRQPLQIERKKKCCF